MKLKAHSLGLENVWFLGNKMAAFYFKTSTTECIGIAHTYVQWCLAMTKTSLMSGVEVGRAMISCYLFFIFSLPQIKYSTLDGALTRSWNFCSWTSFVFENKFCFPKPHQLLIHLHISQQRAIHYMSTLDGNRPENVLFARKISSLFRLSHPTGYHPLPYDTSKVA